MKKFKLLFLMVCLSVSFVKAQTCTTPITVTTNGSWRGIDSFNVSGQWHKFTAVDSYGRIKMYVKNYSTTTFSIDVFNNNCVSLTTITPTLTSAGDSLFLELPSLTGSTDYLIQLKNGTGNYQAYDLAVFTPSNPNVPLSGCISGNCGYPSTVCGELVCNGGFECITGSVTTEGQIATGTANNWTGANWASPDLYSASALTASFSVPCNALGYAMPVSPTGNNNYAGIIVHATATTAANAFNEYLQTKLISPLQAINRIT